MKKAISIVFLAVILTSCGVKPGAVEGDPSHPRTYPDIRVEQSHTVPLP